jgi:hypothetical protein
MLANDYYTLRENNIPRDHSQKKIFPTREEVSLLNPSDASETIGVITLAAVVGLFFLYIIGNRGYDCNVLS